MGPSMMLPRVCPIAHRLLVFPLRIKKTQTHSYTTYEHEIDRLAAEKGSPDFRSKWYVSRPTRTIALRWRSYQDHHDYNDSNGGLARLQEHYHTMSQSD